MNDKEMERAQKGFQRTVDGLYAREATGRGVVAIELAEEMIASVLESGASEQDEGEISDVTLNFYEDAAVFSCRIKVKGQAWPPRPPVDTRVEFGAREVTHSEAGEHGSVMFRVEKPLSFSSKFADIMVGLLGKLMKKLPVSLDALRKRDSLVTIDFADLVRAMRPELAAQAKQVRLYNLKVSQGRVRADVGFVKQE